MEAILEYLLRVAVEKLKKADGDDVSKAISLQVAEYALLKAYDLYKSGLVNVDHKLKALVVENDFDGTYGLCLMFKLTILRAKALASIQLINDGIDPSFDRRIHVLNDGLNFGSSLLEAFRAHKSLTNAIETM